MTYTWTNVALAFTSFKQALVSNTVFWTPVTIKFQVMEYVWCAETTCIIVLVGAGGRSLPAREKWKYHSVNSKQLFCNPWTSLVFVTGETWVTSLTRTIKTKLQRFCNSWGSTENFLKGNVIRLLAQTCQHLRLQPCLCDKFPCRLGACTDLFK